MLTVTSVNDEFRVEAKKKQIPVWMGYFSQAPSTFAHTIFIQNGIQYYIYIAERSRIRSSRGRIKSREKKEEKRKLNESISLHAEKPLFKQSYLFGVRKKKIRIVSIRERHSSQCGEFICAVFKHENVRTLASVYTNEKNNWAIFFSFVLSWCGFVFENAVKFRIFFSVDRPLK